MKRAEIEARWEVGRTHYGFSAAVDEIVVGFDGAEFVLHGPRDPFPETDAEFGENEVHVCGMRGCWYVFVPNVPDAGNFEVYAYSDRSVEAADSKPAWKRLLTIVGRHRERQVLASHW